MRYYCFFFRAVLITACLISILLISVGSCIAQYSSGSTGEVDLDLRSFAASRGVSSTGLSTASLRLNAPVAPGSSLGFYTRREYGQYVTQQFALEEDWKTNTLQVGLVRLPFGIYDDRETYASGLINYPIVRSDYGSNSVDWGVPGVKWSGGGPKLQIETAAFGGRSAGVWNNQQEVDGVAERAQTYIGTLILGVSRWDGYFDTSWKNHTLRNDTHINGLDMRYTLSHLLLRGEYITGTEGMDFSRGWYLDTYYRLPGLEKFTAVARIEELKPDDSMPDGHQVTLGLRYTADSEWIYSVNWNINNLDEAYPYPWTTYSGDQGQLTLQVYRRIDF
jgi:hypothetical protein